METINDLKAAVYDKIVMIERHQLSIKQLQQEIAEISKKIQEHADNKT